MGFFLLLSHKFVLFVSSGPKPCEACRQEEIYEEPISILNSNEVRYDICSLQPMLVYMRHLPCNLYTIPHPHSVQKEKIHDYSLIGVSLTTTSHNATFNVCFLLQLVAL